MADAEQAPLKPMKRQSIGELRSKLHSRIDELRKGRGGGHQHERSPKEDLLDEQRREREKIRLEPKEHRKGSKNDQVGADAFA